MKRTGLRPKLGLTGCPEHRQKAGQAQKISSSGPGFVEFMLVLIAFVFLALGLQERLTSGEVPWLFSGLAIAHLLAFGGCVITWKQVWHGDGHYYVSDLLRTEVIRMEDVCAFVEAHGVLWNTVRIHFRRRTRFGWAASYARAKSARNVITHHLVVRANP